MDQQDKTCLENIYKAYFIIPADKRQYLAGVADGMAAMVVATWPTVQQPQAQAGA